MSFWSALKHDVAVVLGVSAKVEQIASAVIKPFAPGLSDLLNTTANITLSLEALEQGAGLSGTGPQKAALAVSQLEGIYNQYRVSLGLPVVPGKVDLFVKDFVALMKSNFEVPPNA